MAETHVDPFSIEAGESIDFVTDCLSNENADSFDWKVKIALVDSSNASDNGDRKRDSVAEFHGPVAADSFVDLPAQMHFAWRVIFCRPPTSDEFKLSVIHAANQLQAIKSDPRGIASGSNISKQVLVNYCHALLNSNEFVYVD